MSGSVAKAENTNGETRRVVAVIRGIPTSDGAGVKLTRVIGQRALPDLDPFLMLDEFGSEKGADYIGGFPDHPHRGFETVTYMLDGRMRHGDNQGHSGLLVSGSVQWMTAGRGIVHSEMPEQEDGLMRGFQLWVNLPATLKMTTPRYQDIRAGQVKLLSSPDGGALLRLIAGELGGYSGPGVTHTPITIVHATLSPGAQLRLPWRAGFNALAYVLAGSGTVGGDRRPIRMGQLAAFGPGDVVTVAAGNRQDGPGSQLDILFLGGQPIREPVAAYGPFVSTSAVGNGIVFVFKNP